MMGGFQFGTRCAGAVLFSALVLAQWMVPAGSKAASVDPAPSEPLVRAELLSSVASAAPGQSFFVGVQLDLAEGWHVYWEYQGDAGLPIAIEWDLPEGVTAGPIEWPLPERFTEPGDLVVYGYHHQVVLPVEIQVSSEITPGTSFEIGAQVSWLVCRESCIPGEAALERTFTVAAEATPAGGAPLIEQFLSQRPRSELPADAAVNWSREGQNLVLQVSSKQWAQREDLAFYPLPGEGLVLGHVEKGNSSTEAVAGEFRIPLKAEPSHTSSIAGVLVVESENGDQRVGWSLPVSEASSSVAVVSPWSSTLGIALLYAFLGGLILNVMPCVWPALSIKLESYLKHAQRDPREVRSLGLGFAAGMVSCFLLLGALVVALRPPGWGFLFENIYFLIFLLAIVVLAALSLFGVFEFNLPSAVTTKMSTAADREGVLGSYLQGLFATLLGTACTAPFLSISLAFMFTQPAPVVFAIMGAAGLGMSAPYLLMAWKTNWIGVLPKPGPWMERFKQAMGFIMLVVALWLLHVISAGDYSAMLFWVLGFLLALALAGWLKGILVTPLHSRLRNALSLIAVLGFVGVSFFQLIYRPLTAKAEDFWTPFSEEALAEALESGQPAFIDFTAAWCLTCKWNKATVLERSDVKEEFRKNGVVPFVADWTSYDEKITAHLRKLGRAGVPVYVFYSPQSPDTPILLPEILTENLVLEGLEKVLANSPTPKTAKNTSL